MIVFQKDDGKYRSWSRALEARGIAAVAVRGSPLKSFFVVLRQLLAGARVNVYVFRYLNDYPSVTRTVARLVSEFAVVVLIKVFGGRVFWIAHNVDQESSSHHPRISNVRRRFVSKAADVVFVMDPLLTSPARQYIPEAKAIDWLCFGAPDALPLDSGTLCVQSAARELRSRLQALNPESRVYVGLCVSQPSTKCLHFLSVCTFLDSCASAGLVFGLVVVAPVDKIRDIRFQDAACRMRKDPRIALINEAIAVRENNLIEEVDFFYRALHDLSVSYSLYVAASVRKPMIVEAGTFLAQMVEHYELGIVVDPAQASSCVGLDRRILGWDPAGSDRFLMKRNWHVAADQIIKAYRWAPRAPSRQ